MMTHIARYLGAATALAIFVACGGGGTEPRVPVAKTMTVSTAPSASSTVGTSAGVFAVRVLDDENAILTGASVTFTATGGATPTPTTAVTDANGVAQTTITLGTLAGAVTVSATVTGTAIKADAQITATAGSASTIATTTAPSSTSVVGTSAGIFAVRVRDANDNVVSGASVTFAATGGATVTPPAATTNALGIAQTNVTLGSTAGPITVTATVTGTALNANASVTAINVACTALAVGAMATFSNVGAACVTAPAAGAEYAIIAYNTTVNGSNILTATITGAGLIAPPSSAKLPFAQGASRLIAPLGGGASALSVAQDESYHLRQLARDRSQFRSKAAGARAWYASRTSRTGARRNAIPVSPTVGQVISLNVNADDPCDNAMYRGVRVKAVGTKSVVLADTLNPTDGFSDADYQRFADRFDTIVYPMDTENFGAPTDIDGNGRIAILFTAAVNDLSQPGSGSYVGGFFTARDLFPNTAQGGLQGCAGSNVGEMFYMLVPDPTGSHGNVHRKGFVDTITTSTIAHEFQHLINASRRLFVNTTAEDFEDVWLNEGLSHIAQELLYYRESGKQSRQNLSGDDVYTNSRSTYPLFKADVASNFGNVIGYLQAPGANSPIIDNDELATRGSTWSFLRFSTDQAGGSEPAVWTRYGNSTTTGMSTIQFALQQTPAPLLRAWTIANYLDDLGVSVNAQFQHLSWNFRSVYGTVFGSYDSTGTIFTPLGYPLLVSGLTDNVASSISVHGGSASYRKFAVGPSHDATLTFSSGGSIPNAALQFNVVRTK